jgi:hypothetical protein
MSTSVQSTMFGAIAAAEGVRQAAYASAFTTWAFQQGGPYTTYTIALATADRAYLTAVNAACATANLTSKPFVQGPWPGVYSGAPNDS